MSKMFKKNNLNTTIKNKQLVIPQCSKVERFFFLLSFYMLWNCLTVTPSSNRHFPFHFPWLRSIAACLDETAFRVHHLNHQIRRKEVQIA